ncbi:MAG: Riboflavin kinase / FMN adenylyltransferase [Candidatus Uhrbacteria bacterium GW2011_GWA2_53_10]|uniref:riboflavin kinase n=1 Tax=Candidatus Uhrbacteria bacterium GW2011_GWA2_53_10 TaxID=1618980 RepID=A0A0G1XMI4_9BACT|nr:MAG: Riboflavin kinase / FMN adenylyltransferase [Candidatus Uhrbacteria bacterium GW2011_GWA2_53_10]
MFTTPIIFSGRVERGEGMARRLGCPTANLAVQEGTVIPALGVYVGETEFASRWYPSLVCVNDGRDGSHLKVEVHLLHRDVDELEGSLLVVRLFEKIRDLLPWEDEDHMSRVITQDLRQADEWFKATAEHRPA